jgi:hypothetical protein
MANDPKKPCLELRCKQMFYKDTSQPPSEHERAVQAAFGSWDTTSYWCQCTQDSRGPDQKSVNRDACSQAGRSCYRGLESLT